MIIELSPSVLIAAPGINCPVFSHSTVLLMDHGAHGSLGFVIDRPADVTFGEAVGDLGLTALKRVSTSVPVMVGGPVSPESGWVVFDPEGVTLPDDETIAVSPHLGVSCSMTLLRKMARGRGPARAMLMLGYTGWGPGQLEEELAEGAWIVGDADPRLVFQESFPNRWNTALRGLGIDPRRMIAGKMAMA